MAQYKLSYLNLKGRGEQVRIILAFAGVEWEDHRIDRVDWPKWKSSFPWGQVPVLKDRNFTLAQTGAICRYLANKFSLIGESDWESAKCDELVNAIDDCRMEWKKYVHGGDASKVEGRRVFLETHAPFYLGKLSRIKESNSESQWLIGKQVTWADLYISTVLESFEEVIDPNLLDTYPILKKWKNAVYEIPNVQKYISTRP